MAKKHDYDWGPGRVPYFRHREHVKGVGLELSYLRTYGPNEWQEKIGTIHVHGSGDAFYHRSPEKVFTVIPNFIDQVLPVWLSPLESETYSSRAALKAAVEDAFYNMVNV